jgi:hypothetical protein
VTGFRPRIGGRARAHLPTTFLCDAWTREGGRFGDETAGLPDGTTALGRWPAELDTDAVVRLAEAVGESTSWEAMAATPPVAQKLAERARPQPLDLEIARHLRHLQHVCHKPRLHLRVEEERLPVSRARRIPVRAVADLVSHPGDWEHRTLRSIQPSRVLARQIEDEWNLYENRVAVRLVDHLLAYLAKRLEELRKIKEILDASRDYSEQMQRTSYRRAARISELWTDTLESETEAELSRTMERLELAQRDLQTLLGAPLYKEVPSRQAVALSLKPTNILVNDPHYRKVAALWRMWVKYGHKRQETQKQRAKRRNAEASCWDRFALHLVVRGLVGLGWSLQELEAGRWRASRAGRLAVSITQDDEGVVRLSTDRSLSLVPLCADLSGADPDALHGLVESLDGNNAEVVLVHVGAATAVADLDRAGGWTFRGKTVLFGCSPWGIDSEERMARLLRGWLVRAASPAYPVATEVRALEQLPRAWAWIRYQEPHLIALRPPTPADHAASAAWASARAMELDAVARRAKAAKQAFAVAPREAVRAFQRFIDEAPAKLAGMDVCPVCGGEGMVEPRPGRRADGADATWWAMCTACGSEWGTRPCTGCGSRYHALAAQAGLDLADAAENTPDREWPDRVLGRDVWAQPCRSGASGEYRCPECGQCSAQRCRRCTSS